MTETETEVRWKGAEQLRQHLVPVDSLVPFPDNPMRDAQHVFAVGGSLRDFGQVRPILTWENAPDFKHPETGEPMPANTIVGGHHVWLGAQIADNKWTHVAAIPASFDSYDEAREYLKIDNILSARTVEELYEQYTLGGEAARLDPEKQKQVEALLKSGRHMKSVSQLVVREGRQDPADLIEHIAKQLEATGYHEQIVVDRNDVVMAGERVIQAAALLGVDQLPVVKLDLDADDPEAKRIVALEYASGRRAQVDDREFAELLRNIQEDLGSLEGTGYDPNMLANLLLVTRSAAEIKDSNQAMQWIGLSEYAKVPLPVKVMVSFDSAEERDKFLDGYWSPDGKKANAVQLGAVIRKRNLSTISLWWPPRERDDPHSLRFVDSTRKKWQDGDSEVAFGEVVDE